MKSKNAVVIGIICSLFCISCQKGASSISTSSEETSPSSTDIIIPTGLEVNSSHESGFYDNDFYLTLASSCPDIYYTLDGSEPTVDSPKYNQPIHIYDRSQETNKYADLDSLSPLDNYYRPNSPVDKAFVITYQAIDGEEKGPIYHQHFWINKNTYNIKMVSILMDEKDLFDKTRGIYCLGDIYDQTTSDQRSNPYTCPANYNQKGKEWERKANIAVFNGDKTSLLNQDIGIRIQGGWSRAFNQKSLALYARKEYSGTNLFDVPLIDEHLHKSYILRSGGYRDSKITKIRDLLNQGLSSDLGFETQKGEPVQVYLNGEYWGVYNLMEKYSEDYINSYYDIAKKNVEIIECGAVDEGDEDTLDRYQEMVAFFTNTDLSIASNYTIANQYLDIDSFINYMVCELYIGNIDWPKNNVRWYRSIEAGDKVNEDTKWRMMMYDTDDSDNIPDVGTMCTYDSDPFLPNNHWAGGPISDKCDIGNIMISLMKNADFKEKFVSTASQLADSRFAYNDVSNRLNQMKNIYQAPIMKHYQRFVSKDLGETYFNEQVNRIDDYFKNRKNYFLSYINNYFND